MSARLLPTAVLASGAMLVPGGVAAAAVAQPALTWRGIERLIVVCHDDGRADCGDILRRIAVEAARGAPVAVSTAGGAAPEADPAAAILHVDLQPAHDGAIVARLRVESGDPRGEAPIVEGRHPIVLRTGSGQDRASAPAIAKVLDTLLPWRRAHGRSRRPAPDLPPGVRQY